MSIARLSTATLILAAIACAAPASAQYGWGARNWDRADETDWRGPRVSNGPDSREGKVDVDQFVAEDAVSTLGHGTVAVTAAPDADQSSDQSFYEAAVVDQLVKAGYDTATPDPQGGQVAEVRIVRDVLLPEEPRRKPVSGAMSMGVSNRGTMLGMAVSVDMSKPKKALISTRLEARLRDRATNKVLWEGRAEMATREGDGDWTDQAISTRLASALFKDFPGQSAARVVNP